MNKQGRFDLINAAQWLIAGASVLLLFAIWDREQQADELRIAQSRRTELELQLLREREQHRNRADAMLDEINRLRGTDATTTDPASSGNTDLEPELVDGEPEPEPTTE